MIKARLTSGSIVTLWKDCNCQHHEGPHWLHMDKVDRSVNDRLLEASRYGCFYTEEGTFSPLQFQEHAAAELRRLKEKNRNMEMRGICEIIYEDTNENAETTTS